MIRINFGRYFRSRFSYPILQERYTTDEYAQITRKAGRWKWALPLLAVLYMAFFTAVFTFLFHRTVLLVYHSMNGGEQYFPQIGPVFALPAICIGLPLRVFTAIWSMRFFEPSAHKKIIDQLNATYQYDQLAAWRFMIKPLAIAAGIVLLITGWSYVRVEDNGFALRNAAAIDEVHFSYSDIASITHFRRSMEWNGKVENNDHYQVVLNNGKTLFAVAPSVDFDKCIAAIIARSHIAAVEKDMEVMGRTAR